MRCNPDYQLESFAKEFDNYRERYRKGIEALLNDILLTAKLQIRAQNDVNTRLRLTP